MIKGAIFDMDGVLLNSNGYWDRAAEAYLRQLGVPARPGLAQSFFEMTLPEAAEHLIRHYGVAQTPDQILEGVNREMWRFYSSETPLREGIRELIHALQRKGIPLIIATVTDRPLVETALGRHGLLDHFEGMVTAAEAGAGKKQPDIFLKAAARIQTRPENTLVFEDALHAIHTAKQAGFVTVGIYDAYSEEKQAEIKETADVYLKGYEDLTALWRVL